MNRPQIMDLATKEIIIEKGILNILEEQVTSASIEVYQVMTMKTVGQISVATGEGNSHPTVSTALMTNLHRIIYSALSHK